MIIRPPKRMASLLRLSLQAVRATRRVLWHGFLLGALTSVSGAEEFIIETFIMKGRARERGIQRRLELQGYHASAAFAGRGFAVRDCNLVTSQNPFSGAAFADAYVAALTDWRQGVDCSCSASAGRR